MDMSRIAAAEKAAKAKGLVDDAVDSKANAPAGPAWLMELDARRKSMAGGGTLQDLVDVVMAAPGTLKSWTEDLVKKSGGKIEQDEAHARVAQSIMWYRRGKKLIAEGEKEKLVDA